MIPHLIHIGLPKTGSTFLQAWFEAHPQLAYRQGGIAGFPDIYAVAAAGTVPGPQIRCRVTSSEVLSAPRPDAGRESVDYGRAGRASFAEEQARVCAILADICPGATILMITRGYRAAILSGYSQFVRTGGAEDFADALAPPPRDYPWSYDRLVGLYREAFGRDRVVVLPFELLRDDPRRFLGEIERRLGLDPFPFSAPPANMSVSAAELAWYPALSRGLARIGLARGPILRWYRGMLYRRRLAPLARLLQRIAPRPPVAPELIDAAFLDRFRGEAETLRGEPLYRAYLADYLL